MKRIVVFGILATLMLSACGNVKVSNYVKDDASTGQEQPVMNTEKEVEQETEITDPTESEEVTKPVESVERDGENQFSFSNVADREFYFASGVGAWNTVLWINDDGSFHGIYHDSDMGSTGDGYSNGTMYYSEFKGKFTKPEKVNDYTYKFQIEEISYVDEVGTETINDEMKFVYTEAYGLDDVENLYMYLPGTPLSELSEEFLWWIGYPDIKNITDTELSFYALYNEKPEYGFLSYKAYEDSVNEISASTPYERAKQSLDEAKERADELESQLESGLLPQIELNMTANEIYMVWDEQLNYIWQLMKENLPKDKMDEILQEQRTWISEKERKAKEAGSECEGGSMQPLLENSEAARLTRERAYELLEYLK